MERLEWAESQIQSWAHCILEIGNLYRSQGDYKTVCDAFIKSHYAYDYGVVLFKPTLAVEHPFRTNKTSAKAYFLGEDKNYIEDKGFAIQSWNSINFVRDHYQILSEGLVWQGSILFENQQKKVIKAETTMVFKLFENDEKLLLIAHHSSLPHSI